MEHITNRKMEFRTSISETIDGKHLIRGKDVVELISKHSFAEAVFLLLRGDIPAPREAALLEAMLVAAMENGLEAPSIFVPRIVKASGNAFHVALASGMLAIGEHHGGAGERAAEMFASGRTAEEVVEEWMKKGMPVPGFGHKIYKNEDPRATALHAKAKELGFACEKFKIAYEVEAEIERRKGKKIPLNIDGAQAACLLEAGLDWRLGKAVFLMARIVGMSAHILEETQQNTTFYRLDQKEIRHEA